MKTNEWYTPQWVLDPLGEFDLDPCFPVHPLFQTARRTYNILQDGLQQAWAGRVWLNPPYSDLQPWLERMAANGNGIALIPARTETATFQQLVFARATSILFLDKRIFFLKPDGGKAKWNSGVSSVLIAYNEDNADVLHDSGLGGHHLWLQERLILVGFSKSWRLTLQAVLIKELSLDDIYRRVEEMAPGKVNGNKNYRAKIRQQLQKYFTRTKRATYA